jgi:hypothetical protein
MQMIYSISDFHLIEGLGVLSLRQKALLVWHQSVVDLEI